MENKINCYMENANPRISAFAFKCGKQQIRTIQQLKDFEVIGITFRLELSATVIGIDIKININ